MSRSSPNRCGARLLALALACLIAGTSATHAALDEELQVQAAYLYNFVKFCAWPDDAEGTPLIIGLMGGNPFGTALDELRGAIVKGRTIQVREIAGADAARHCHVLYVARPAHGRAVEVVSALGSLPVLTVSEAPGFARAGGVIEFAVVSDTVKFRVNVGAARRHGLKLSSQLLGVAIEVVKE